MDHLYRELAPFSEAAWGQIEDEAKSRLVTQLAARKLVDLSGPHGWGHSATDLGRVEEVAAPRGRRAVRRACCPWWSCGRRSPCPRRARRRRPGRGRHRAARARRSSQPDRPGREPAVFHGYAAAGILGITESSSHARCTFGEDMEQYPKAVAQAVDVLRRAGIGGPYGWPSAPPSTPGSWRRPSTAGTCSSIICARSSAARWSGRPASTGASSLSLSGGDFVIDERPGPLHRLQRPRRRRRAALYRGELQLPGGRARRGSGADPGLSPPPVTPVAEPGRGGGRSRARGPGRRRNAPRRRGR